MAATTTQGPLRVFLIEDSPDVCDLFVVFFHVPGEIEIVGHADTENESVAAILAAPVDVVVVDLNLREGNGLAVIEKIRRANPSPRPSIIVFTNQPFPEIRHRAMQLEADYFFDKSVDFDAVRDTLRKLRSR
ncbi:MAG: response regulator [Burkholderiales bacterium]|nr:response regulator [Burkholderiales bacterium]